MAVDHMFLSPMDVHVNRTSVTGAVTRVEYHPGKFLPGTSPDAGDLNEWTEVGSRLPTARSCSGKLSGSWPGGLSTA